MCGQVSRRSGFGIVLLAIALFFVVVFVVALARHQQGDRARSSARVATMGTLALDVARSALEEAIANLTERVNAPSDRLFAALRSGEATGLSLKVPVRKLTGLLRRDKLLSGFAVEGGTVEVKVITQEPLGSVPYETRGTWRLEAAVRHGPSRIVRRVSEERPFRVALLSTPRPFDQFTALVLHATPLVGEDANERIDRSRKSLIQLAKDEKPRIMTRLTRAIDYVNARFEKAATLARLLDLPVRHYDTESFLRFVRRVVIPEAPIFWWDITRRYHYFPSRYALGTRAERLDDLGRLYLAPRVRQHVEAVILPAARAYDQAYQRFDNLVDQAEELASRTFTTEEQYLNAVAQGDRIEEQLKGVLENELGPWMERLAAAHSNLLEMFRQYTDEFIETADEATDWLRGFTFKLEGKEWARKAFHRFEGAGAVSGFLAFLDRYQAEEHPRPINGVVYLDNPRERLMLSGRTIHGKLTLLVTGDAHLRYVRLKDPANDLFVLQCEGTLTTAGRVAASLVPHGRFVPDPDMEVGGTVVFDKVEAPHLLRGAVSNPDFRYYSGVTGAEGLEHLYVALSPWPAWASMQRR